MDSQRIKDNFALVAVHGETVAKYFYDDLFERAPELRELFTSDLGQQQQKLLTALSDIVAAVDDPDTLVPYLRRLGAYHGSRGISPENYPIVGASLIATLRYFSGDAWSEEVEADWAAAYGVVTEVMVGASA